MIIKAGLLIDFGNSETRVCLISGNRVYRFNMSNKFVQLPSGYRIPGKYTKDGSTFIFSYKGVYFANGLIVDREFTGQEIRPSALQSKTSQLSTELSLNLAFIKSLILLSSIYNIGVKDLDVTFNVSVLLPPLDHDVHEEKMISLVTSFSSVNLVIPLEFGVSFTVGEVTVHSEAVAGFFGAFYKEDGVKFDASNVGKDVSKGDIIVRDYSGNVNLVEVESNKKFMNGYVLVLDIGAGTTDVALFLDMGMVESSKDTFKRGGNSVESIIRVELKKRFGFSPTSMDRVISRGELEEGVEVHDVADIVTMAKETYSKYLVEDLRQYLERMMIDIPVIKGLLVIGGGSLPSERDGEVVSPSMAHILKGFLKELAPKMELVDVDGKDLRDINLEGLLYIYKYA